MMQEEIILSCSPYLEADSVYSKFYLNSKESEEKRNKNTEKQS